VIGQGEMENQPVRIRIPKRFQLDVLLYGWCVLMLKYYAPGPDYCAYLELILKLYRFIDSI